MSSTFATNDWLSTDWLIADIEQALATNEGDEISVGRKELEAVAQFLAHMPDRDAWRECAVELARFIRRLPAAWMDESSEAALATCDKLKEKQT